MAEPGAQKPRVTIEGLREWQCDGLQEIKKGSLLEVAVFSPLRERDHDKGSDEGSERVGQEDDQENDEKGISADDEGDEDAQTSEELGEVSEPDTPPSGPPVETATKQEDTAEDEGRRIAFDPSDPASNLSITSIFGSFAGQIRADTQDHQTQEQVPDGAVPSDVDGGSDHGHEADSDGGEEDHSDDDRDEVEVEREEGGDELRRDLYVVLSITTADENDPTVFNVELRELTYQDPGEEANFDSYRIYGTAIKLHDESTTVVNGEEPIFLKDILDCEPENTFSLTLNPSGDHIRDTFFHSRCPANCNRGWLPDLPALRAVYCEYLPDVRPFRPVCPVCLGKDLMSEQVMLRFMLGNTSTVDLGHVVEFLGNLNTRRRQLGYSFVQFDEREWGYGFDDMLDESDDDGEGRGDVGQFELWNEAMDPNANPKTRPASEGTIASLSRKKYEGVAKKEVGAFCAICQEGAFEEESLVVELPCGHVYDAGCLEAWIREYDNCPECRATVSGMIRTGDEKAGGKDDEAEEDGLLVIDGKDGVETDLLLGPADVASAEREKESEDEEDDEEEDEDEPEMDGEDVVMSEVEYVENAASEAL